MANISGKATAITVITPMKPWKSWILRFLFRLITWGFFAQIQKNLVKLSFIHFANWSIVSRKQFPQLADDQPLDRTRYDYLLFVSNFNGSWDQYIDAFTAVIPLGIGNIWRWSERYPGALPEDDFFAYIKHNQLASEYYYNAAPDVSATDVQQALILTEELDQFAQSAQQLSAEEFAVAYDSLLLKVQNSLGQTGLTEWLEPPTPRSQVQTIRLTEVKEQPPRERETIDG